MSHDWPYIYRIYNKGQHIFACVYIFQGFFYIHVRAVRFHCIHFMCFYSILFLYKIGKTKYYRKRVSTSIFHNYNLQHTHTHNTPNKILLGPVIVWGHMWLKLGITTRRSRHRRLNQIAPIRAHLFSCDRSNMWIYGGPYVPHRIRGHSCIVYMYVIYTKRMCGAKLSLHI